jgi:hypothetical protein
VNKAYINATEFHVVIIVDKGTDDRISTNRLIVKSTASFLNCMYSYGYRSLDAMSNGTFVTICPGPDSDLLGVMNNPWNMSPEGFS